VFLCRCLSAEIGRRGLEGDEDILEVIAQTTVTLPYLDDQVPALYLSDGRPYIPIFVVCKIFGIRADTHIQRWRKLLLWETARKLPFQTEKQGKRLVWCLLISEVPFLYHMFSWKHLSPERQAQLHQAARAGMKLAWSVYQEMQQRYKMTRQTLFSLLAECSDINEKLDRQLETQLSSLDQEVQGIFIALVERGRAVHHQVADHARHMLHEQNSLPILDGVMLDAENTVIDTFSLPLLPLVPHEERELLINLLHQLAVWHQEMAVFWREQQD
jgi:hypothetical protein